MMETVWIFTGPRAQFPAGVFSQREKAEQWIHQHKLTGTLTVYPMDAGVYDWAISTGLFAATREDQRTPEFIQRFSSATRSIITMKKGMRPDEELVL